MEKDPKLAAFIAKHKIPSNERVTYEHFDSNGNLVEVHTRPDVDIDDQRYRTFKTYKD